MIEQLNTLPRGRIRTARWVLKGGVQREARPGPWQNQRPSFTLVPSDFLSHSRSIYIFENLYFYHIISYHIIILYSRAERATFLSGSKRGCTAHVQPFGRGPHCLMLGLRHAKRSPLSFGRRDQVFAWLCAAFLGTASRKQLCLPHADTFGLPPAQSSIPTHQA